MIVVCLIPSFCMNIQELRMTFSFLTFSFFDSLMADVFPGVEYVPSTLDALRAAINDVSEYLYARIL